MSQPHGPASDPHDAPTEPPLPPPPAPPPARRSSATGLLLGLTLAALLLLGVSVGVVYWALNRVDVGKVKEGTFLSLELSGVLPDAPPEPGIFDDPESQEPTVTEMAEALHRAAADERIEGLYLVLEGSQAGWASYQELREALVAFQASGKPCVAYSPSVITNGGYYLASACGTVVMSPAAVSFVMGLSVELTYYKGTFEKLGIEPEYEHVGDFKSFIEAYERTGPSPSAAEAYEAMLDSLYGQMVAGIAEGRGMTPEQVRAAIDDPTMVPRTALERGLVDALAWPDALAVHVHEVANADWLELLDQPVTEDDEPRLTKMKEYLKGVRADEGKRGAKIAVLHAEGSIVPGDDSPSLFGGGGMLTDREYARWMEEVREDDDIEAVVVRVNSPGGSALASALMWRENARTQAVGKPVVISMADYAASGGYMISANADWIVAEPGTLTGSIGVFAGKFDLSGTYDKLGMTTHAFQRGRMADLFSLSSGFDDEEREVFRAYLIDFYDQFLDLVAEGREMDRDAVHAVAQGRVWTGEQALERGLVDQLGTLRDALDKAAELAELETWSVKHVPQRKTFFELILEEMNNDAMSSSAAMATRLGIPIADEVLHEMAVLERIERAGGVAAYLPGAPQVR